MVSRNAAPVGWSGCIGAPRTIARDTRTTPSCAIVWGAWLRRTSATAICGCTPCSAAKVAFCDFPAEHWKHVRSSSPIESTFATVRFKTNKTKGCLSYETALAMVFKLAKSAERHWRRLDGASRFGKLIEGIEFRDGEAVQDAEEQTAA